MASTQFAVDDCTLVMLKLERSADIVQRFRMADEQRAAGFQIIVKGIDDLPLHFVVKVDDDVAAEYDLRFLHPPELFLVAQVDLPEGDEPLEHGVHFVKIAFLPEVGGDNFLGRGAQGVFIVHAAPGRGEHGFRKVVGRDLDVPSADALLSTSCRMIASV